MDIRPEQIRSIVKVGPSCIVPIIFVFFLSFVVYGLKADYRIALLFAFWSSLVVYWIWIIYWFLRPHYRVTRMDGAQFLIKNGSEDAVVIRKLYKILKG